MATYSTIQPPFTLNFSDMPKAELRNYFKWFQEITPERIAQLAFVVKSSHGFDNWQSDFSPDSLNALGDWFAGQIKTRRRTKEEIDDFNARAPFPIEISDSELTNRTFSLAMDIGMYIGQVFSKNHPFLKWDQPFGSKRNIDYGQPVLAGFWNGRVPFNPVHMVVTFAYGLQRHSRTGAGLREIYERWSNNITIMTHRRADTGFMPD